MNIESGDIDGTFGRRERPFGEDCLFLRDRIFAMERLDSEGKLVGWIGNGEQVPEFLLIWSYLCKRGD